MKQLSFGEKPTRRVVSARVPYGVNPKLVCAVYPDGTIGIRELRRRKEYRLELGTLYVSAIRAEIRERKNKRKKG